MGMYKVVLIRVAQVIRRSRAMVCGGRRDWKRLGWWWDRRGNLDHLLSAGGINLQNLVLAPLGSGDIVVNGPNSHGILVDVDRCHG